MAIPEPASAPVVLFEENRYNQDFVPATFRSYVHRLVKDLDEKVYNRLKTDEFLALSYILYIKKSEDSLDNSCKDGLFHSEGDIFLDRDHRTFGLHLLRDDRYEYGGYIPGCMRAIREFRKMGPEYPSLDIVVSMIGYRDIFRPEGLKTGISES
ncbi:MAG: hypothetical protein Q7R96_02670 [Nanoarchaeota archaeon]|nr:hypothetical protein [Nanoarchaeota archaeon]